MMDIACEGFQVRTAAISAERKIKSKHLLTLGENCVETRV